MEYTKIDSGGQAFPSPIGDMGMSLRDWLAGQALVGIMQIRDEEYPSVRTICENIGIPEAEYNWIIHLPIYQSYLAYKIANAMIAQRSKHEN